MAVQVVQVPKPKRKPWTHQEPEQPRPEDAFKGPWPQVKLRLTPEDIYAIDPSGQEERELAIPGAHDGQTHPGVHKQGNT